MDVVVSDVDSELESECNESELESEWKQIEDDIHRLSVLQTDAHERMAGLARLLSSLTPDECIVSTIQQCHRESLQELEETGEVSFGQRLLAVLGKTMAS
jgi:hypothetical protein